MTLLELNTVLGRQIELLTDETTPYLAKKNQAEIAQTVSSLAKQVINAADVTLRTEKLAADGKLKNAAIIELVGGKK